MKILLLQLPVPQLNFGRRTGNIPLAAACLRQAWMAADRDDNQEVGLLPQLSATYLGDQALLNLICAAAPRMVGFTTYAWNVERTLYLTRSLKERLGCRVILGGPEITRDNPLLTSSAADIHVCGEGEGFRPPWNQTGSPEACGWVAVKANRLFGSTPSPYLDDLLTPEIDDIVLLETQRGCPHRCGYCFYGKGRSKISLAEEVHLLAATRWTHDRGIGELYLLDPSLDARPHLSDLLRRMALINNDGALALHSEIRAEAVDVKLADGLATAGFRSFEIGLQSTNPQALERTGRNLRLGPFLNGVRLLQSRGMVCSVDLIVGLPGDSLAGFRKSVDFLVDQGLADHLQVFPLAILPGTRFRRQSQALGLHFDPAPPYLLIHSETFSMEDIEAALDYAESRGDLALYPPPDLDIAWRHPPGGDLVVSLDGKTYYQKLILTSDFNDADLEAKAQRLTHPYQLFVEEGFARQTRVETALTILTRTNPYTPLELILLAPRFDIQVERLLAAARLARPHYLDNDLRFAPGPPGNRALLITLATPRTTRLIRGPMCRQALWWREPRLPRLEEMEDLALEGILLGGQVAPVQLQDWQDRNARRYHRLPAISFEETALQRRWLYATTPTRMASGLIYP